MRIRRPLESRLRVVLAAVAGAVIFLCAASASSWAQEDQDAPQRLRGRVLPERAGVELVLIDVLVRSRDGSPASGLTPEEFELRIDSRPSPVASFEDYCQSPPPSSREAAASHSERSGAPTATRAADPMHIILLFDLNHLTRAGRNRSLRAAIRYAREGFARSHRVMILAMKDEPILVEPFTGDSERVAERLEAMLADEEMLDLSFVEEGQRMVEILGTEALGAAGRTGISREEERLKLARPYSREDEAKARRSLSALRDLMPALASIPGRKTLVHFSERLRDEPGIQYLLLAGSNPRRERIDVRMLLQDVHREANDAGVSVYTVWAAGLGEGGSAGAADASVRAIVRDVALFNRARLAGEDAALALGTTLSLETGGRPLKRTNDLGKVFTMMNEDLGCYYVLGYRNTGRGDGARHGIRVKVKGRRYRVRHRPYYIDWSDDERLERRFRSALMAPGYFRALPVSAEPYALAPRNEHVPVLFQIAFPLSEVTLVRQGDGSLYGEAEVRGTVWDGAKEVCKAARRIPLEVPRGEPIADRDVIYEFGCELRPGDYDLTAAVLDAATWLLGGAERAVPVGARSPGILGDVLLWTSSGEDILVATDAASIGIRDSGSGRGFVPRPERRFSERESGLLYVIVCPPEGRASRGVEEVLVRRTLLRGGQEIASYAPVTPWGGEPWNGTVETEPVSLEDGTCRALLAPVGPSQLTPGTYVFEVAVDGMESDSLLHRVGFAVDSAPE
jgi:VWFA-related protein